MKTITIIDTFGFFFRAYYALPPLRNSEGFPTGLLTGFINLVDSLHRNHATDYLVFALDSKGPTFRNEIYPAYKANRESPPQELIEQLPIAIEWIEKMGFANLSEEGFEADDIITTVTKFAREQNMKVTIVSHDKDLYQLIDDTQVVMYNPIDQKEVDEEACVKKFGVSPEDFINFQAIVGDSSDNVPGVKGIGVKGAAKLINEYHTLEAIYADIENAGTPRIQQLLLESKESAFLSRKLVQMRDDVYDFLDLSQFVFEKKNYLSCLCDEFEKYEMRQAIKKAEPKRSEVGYIDAIKATPKPQKASIHFKAVTLNTREKLFEVIETFNKETLVAFDTETTGLDTKTASMVGFSFCSAENRAYYVPVGHSYLGVETQVSEEDAVEALRKLMQCRVIGQNLKFDLSLLYNRYNQEEIVPFADTMIMAWLSDPGRKVGLDALARKFFKYEMKPFKEMVKKGENFSSVAIAEATFYAAEDAWMTFLLYGAIQKKMELGSLTHLLQEAKQVEYLFINVLIRMEQLGIKVDQPLLEVLQGELSKELALLTEQIYALAETEFNIRSTQQLGVVLFQQLGLQGGKKTKTGYSTNEAVLQSLKKEHPVIEKILSYREYQKILSTYVEPLLKLAQKDKKSRIYTSFLQTGTATGRLSSKDPNLQNIPVRSELGRRVRDAFIAKEGYRLVSIDYSQIELRLLAHFSQDAALLEAFKMGVDIHMATAIKLFGESEAKAKRNFAKSVNFGLLYGMGPKKLSDELGVTQAEAKEIIANYFNSFPTVKQFLEGIQEQVKVDGYVETILGRRRLFDYDSANGMQKAAFMRESVNTVFQGSAADLIKLSMLEIDTCIKEENLDAFMLLQIHDELIFEIEEHKVDVLSKRFVDIMESVYELNVPLECSVSTGSRWGELK
ncbi:MAG: DNA polymerase I [Sulfurovum sp.]|nr:DNA polymerase I [Sulfurovum sp.]MCB4746936.1 DNA polymerase I [Sulfurovum sp.]MCB4749065.1 DNA polymerase I [Sulfurovum sp.]MCB4750869.1 DNA polymerase I [Sulfurovum sp.]MCB4758336.1 DNA polymerase I [Sulfurovum sp.]